MGLHTRHRILSLDFVEKREVAKSGASPPMAADAANLDKLLGAGAIPDQLQGAARGPSIGGKPEVGPVEVTMVPGRLPCWVEIEHMVKDSFTLVGIDRIEEAATTVSLSGKTTASR